MDPVARAAHANGKQTELQGRARATRSQKMDLTHISRFATESQVPAAAAARQEDLPWGGSSNTARAAKMDACTAEPAEVRAQEFGNVQSFDRTIRPMRGVQVHPAPITDTCGGDSAQQTSGVPGAIPGPLEKLIQADYGRDPSSSETDKFESSTSVSLATLAPASRGFASPRLSRRALMEPPSAFGSEKFIFDGGLPPIQKSGFTAAPVSKLDRSVCKPGPHFPFVSCVCPGVYRFHDDI